jgi:hypothetical protein
MRLATCSASGKRRFGPMATGSYGVVPLSLDPDSDLVQVSPPSPPEAAA